MRTDKEEGVRAAKLAPDCRTAGGSCGSGGNAQVKDQLKDGLGPSTKGNTGIQCSR